MLPASAWLPGKAEALLRELLEASSFPCLDATGEALALSRGAFAHAPAAAWRAYFTAAAGEVDASWRWYPVLLFLNQRQGVGHKQRLFREAGGLRDVASRGERSRNSSVVGQVSLPRPVLSALPAALQAELPQMSEASCFWITMITSHIL